MDLSACKSALHYNERASSYEQRNLQPKGCALGRRPCRGIDNQEYHPEGWRFLCHNIKEMKAKGYQGSITAAKALARMFPENRSNTIILDIGGGTGLVGEELKKEGFEIMDILDSSDKMLAVARQKRIYRNVIRTEVRGHNSTTLDADSYDAVLCIAGICTQGPGFTCSDIKEMIRLTKSGGIIIMTMRTETLFSNLYRDKLVPWFHQLQSDGLWEQLEWSQFNYMYGIEGQLFIYKKL